MVSGAQRADEFETRIRWVSDIIRFVGGFLPGFASTWVNGYARDPWSFLGLAILVSFFVWWGMRIASRISDRMGSIWRGVAPARSGLPDNFIYRLRTHPRYIAFHEGVKRKWAPAFFAILFVYLGLSLASHLLYNIQDVWGMTCKESGNATGLNKNSVDPRKDGDTKTMTFDTSDLCKPTGILLERNARYHVEVNSTESWTDAGIRVPDGGFSPNEQPVWYHRILLGFGVPLRRELTQDWFRIVLRYGGVGGEEVFLDPDPDDYKIQANIKPTRDGELFIFVNDAVIGIPGLYDLLYRQNGGRAKLTVTRR